LASRNTLQIAHTMTVAENHELQASRECTSLVPLPQLLHVQAYNPNALLDTYVPRSVLEKRCGEWLKHKCRAAARTRPFTIPVPNEPCLHHPCLQRQAD
jgi:hypothetical protein